MKTKNHNSEFGNGFIRIFTFLFVIITIGFPVDLISQEKPDSAIIKTDSLIYLLKLNDGTELIGKLIEETENEMKLATENFGDVTVLKNRIKKITLLDASDFVKGMYWFKNPNSTRYFFGPSAFNLEPGEGYYQNTYLIFNSFNVGITKNFSFGGGFEFLSTFGIWNDDKPQPIFYLTPKIGFKISDNLNAGAGVLYLSVPGYFSDEDTRKGVGIVYGITTFGNTNHNITAGLGWGYSGTEFDDRPIITLSAMTRISKRASLVTENWIIPAEEKYMGIYSYGIRFFGERISVDLGFINNKDIIKNIIIGIPYVDFVVKFGK